MGLLITSHKNLCSIWVRRRKLKFKILPYITVISLEILQNWLLVLNRFVEVKINCYFLLEIFDEDRYNVRNYWLCVYGSFHVKSPNVEVLLNSFLQVCILLHVVKFQREILGMREPVWGKASWRSLISEIMIGKHIWDPRVWIESIGTTIRRLPSVYSKHSVERYWSCHVIILTWTLTKINIYWGKTVKCLKPTLSKFN